MLECGAGVSNVNEGDRVLVQNNDVRECFADEVTLAAERVVRVPAEIRLTDIAGFPLNFGTSYYALAHRAKLMQGEVLAVHGASGGVGLAAVKLGKMMGATVIGTGGDDEKLRIVRAQGADYVVNYRTEPLADRIRELTGGRGADVSFDPVGGDVFDACMRSTAIDGRILVVGFAGGRIPSAPANRILFGALFVIGAPYGGFTQRNPERWAELMSALLDKVRAGDLKPLIHRRFTFAQAPEALATVAERKVIGKCILVSERGQAEEPACAERSFARDARHDAIAHRVGRRSPRDAVTSRSGLRRGARDRAPDDRDTCDRCTMTPRHQSAHVMQAQQRAFAPTRSSPR